jgi:Sulfotransferase domain
LASISAIFAPIILWESTLESEGLGSVGHCQIIKTHYPHLDFPSRLQCTFPAKKAIVLTRDPINYAISLFNLQATSTHDEKLDPKIYIDKPYFTRYMKGCAWQYNLYHDYWFNNKQIPRLIVRLDDYFADPKGTLLKMMQFIEGTENLKPFLVERLNQMERDGGFNSSPYIKKGERNAGGSQNAFQCVRQEHVENFVNYPGNKEIISRLGYVSLLKSKFPFLNGLTDWKDEENMKFIKEISEQSFQKCLTTKPDDLPNMIVPKWKVELKNLALAEHALYTPGTLSRNLVWLHKRQTAGMVCIYLVMILVLYGIYYILSVLFL